jgi:hypothetical protein
MDIRWRSDAKDSKESVMAVRGWIVSVAYSLDGVEVVQRYDVAIAAPDEAAAAVRQRMAAFSEVRITVEEQLFDATFFGLGLLPGDVRARVARRR